MVSTSPVAARIRAAVRAAEGLEPAHFAGPLRAGVIGASRSTSLVQGRDDHADQSAPIRGLGTRRDSTSSRGSRGLGHDKLTQARNQLLAMAGTIRARAGASERQDDNPTFKINIDREKAVRSG